jgi:hypothetical protein
MSVKNWMGLAFRPDIAGRARRVAMIVGSILTIINQGDVILNGEVTVGTIGKIILTFCVPYCVSTYAGVGALIDQGNGQ